MAETLFSGWAPDAPADDTLLRSFVLAQADRGTFLHERLGCPVLRTDEVAAFDLSSPVLFDNLAVILQPPTMIDVRAAATAVVDFYPPDRPFVLFSAWPVGDLHDLGLALMGHPPMMFRSAGGSPPALPDGLHIEEVTDDDGAFVFGRTLLEAYPMAGDRTPGFVGDTLGGPIRLFVGYDGERPVATAGTVVEHGINDVEWVAVMPDVRGRGFGEALTWAATLADPSLPAMLIASDDGVATYRRMGYHPLVRATLWFRGAL
jgi:hypothetical protein